MPGFCRHAVHSALVLLCALALPASAGIVSIPVGNLAGDAQTLDFESASAGPISGTDALFTAFGVDQVTLYGSSSVGDTLSSNVSGNTLAAASGALAIVAPGGAMDNGGTGFGFGFELSGTATQFGFLVTDQINFSFTFETYLGGSLLDTLVYSHSGSFPNPPIYFESSVPFDEVRFLTPSGAGGWGVDDLTFANIAAVPEPTTLTLFGLGLLGGAAVLRRRRRRTRSLAPKTGA